MSAAADQLIAALRRFRDEHGVPNRIRCAELVMHHGAPAPATRCGLTWHLNNVAIAQALLADGIRITRDNDGAFTLAPVDLAPARSQ